MEIPQKVKGKIKPAIKGIIFVLVIFYLILFLKPNTWQLIILLSSISIVISIWSSRHNLKPKKILKNAFKTIITISIFVYLIKFLGKWGLIGSIIIIIIMTLYKILKQKSEYVESLRIIEEMIWKKPLDKDKWNKGELKNTKVKVVWK